MKVLLTGIAAAVLIAWAIGAFLPLAPKLAWQAYSSTSARVGDPGSNLVGPGWTGENQPPSG
jgi:hypothetical protein